MNHLWLAYDALVVTTGAVLTVLLLIIWSRRAFLRPFTLFYATFTLGLLVALSRGYATLNVTALPVLPVFLSYGLGAVLSCAALFFAVCFAHRALELERPRIIWGVGVALLLASVLMVTPLGVSFEASQATYQLMAPYFLASTIHLAVFAYVVHLCIRAARLHEDRYDTLFFRGMLAFALVGFIESAIGLLSNWSTPVGRLDAQSEEFLYSSIPYLLFSLFLGFYLSRLIREPVVAAPDGARVTPDLGLSQREQQVLELVLDGLNNKRIATALEISVATVKTHLYNIFRKANVSSRFELARLVESSGAHRT